LLVMMFSPKNRYYDRIMETRQLIGYTGITSKPLLYKFGLTPQIAIGRGYEGG
jgi:hypothetical protein